ncbi:MAG TPA: SCO family protein [Solirubrobacteraceae bacterium]|jgi:protein SCO1/2
MEPATGAHDDWRCYLRREMRGKQGFDFRLLLALVALVVIAGGVALLTTGGSSSKTASAKAKQADFHAAGLLSPAAPAPPLRLRDYLGRPIDISSYRGKVVLVTFLYTHCPDICPLIASNLGIAQKLMGLAEAAKVRIVAVSVDPRGDTPKTVAAFLARRNVTGRMDYLLGSTSQLARVWQAWGVGSERDAGKPEFVNHSGLVYGISASGKRMTIYASNFQPADIVHDVPLLAAR